MPVTKTAPSKETLERIIQEIPTPFHLYDESAIRARVRALQKAFAWNGGYREYFAVKANPNPRIVQILREEGCGVDCSSLTELMLAQALGFSGEEIMFSSNMTPANEFEYARSLNAIINLDMRIGTRRAIPIRTTSSLPPFKNWLPLSKRTRGIRFIKSMSSSYLTSATARSSGICTRPL